MLEKKTYNNRGYDEYFYFDYTFKLEQPSSSSVNDENKQSSQTTFKRPVNDELENSPDEKKQKIEDLNKEIQSLQERIDMLRQKKAELENNNNDAKETEKETKSSTA